MLPDFIFLKRELGRALRSRVHEAVDADPLASLVRHHRQHEGDRITIIRQDGTIETRHFEETRASVTIETEDIRSGGVGAAVAAVDTIGGQLTEAVGRRLTSEIESASELAGTVVRGKGFTPEAILEALEKSELSFDEHGAWMPQTVVCHPSARAALVSAYEQLDAVPELRARLDVIIHRQREAWRAREARRTLVD